jgi:hypothetical protein
MIVFAACVGPARATPCPSGTPTVGDEERATIRPWVRRIGRLVLTNCDAFDQFPPAPFGLIVKAGRRPARLRAMMTSVRPKALRHSILGFGGLAGTRFSRSGTRSSPRPSHSA